MLKKLTKMLEQKEARKAELNKKVQESEDLKELRSINVELGELNDEIAELKDMIDEAEERQAQAAGSEGQNGGEEGGEEDVEGESRSTSPVGGTQILATYGVNTGEQHTNQEEERAKMEEKYEKRGKDLKEGRTVDFALSEIPELRTVTIGGGTLINETKYSKAMNETFNEVSRVIDVVDVVPLEGGESYEKAFEVSGGDADYTGETADYNEDDPVFDYVSINKAKITAYTELSDEAQKLPNVKYQEMVKKSITKALRKKISKQILSGVGGANKLTGIFNAPEKVIPAATDLQISKIGPDTLDNIVINYGGDEEVEGLGYLALNKLDLAAFANVRDANGKKLYKIKVNGATGTISSEESFEVPFIINSICPALSASDTAKETYCMAYGMMKGYELAMFSAMTVEESKDYKFKSGQIAYRGSVWSGGNAAMYKGFIRIKKK